MTRNFKDIQSQISQIGSSLHDAFIEEVKVAAKARGFTVEE